ncbi:MAG: hypothetical protein HY791_34950 [Deltaproteobacteria bacterium]|nr:hypothetical protein [Deltaproteobacteria bacterium]
MVTQFLDEEVLVSLTDRWLVTLKSRLVQHPILRARLDLLAAAREPFLEARAVLGIDARRRMLTEQLVATDERFDGLVRGIDALFEAWANLGQDKEETDKVLALRAVILPEGRYVTLKSYSGEQGVGLKIAENLTEERRALLAAIPSIEGRTLLSEVIELIAAAERIGLLLAEQSRLKLEIEAQNISHEEAWERKKRVAKEIEKLTEDMADVIEDTTLLQEALGPLSDEQAKYRASRVKPKELPPIPVAVLTKKPAGPRKRPRFRTEGSPEASVAPKEGGESPEARVEA